MSVRSLDHATIRTDDLATTRAFYEQSMGLTSGARPPFDFPGAWLYGGDGTPVIHLIGIEKNGVSGSGAVDHIAFSCDGFESLRARLDRAEIPYRERVVPGLGLRQLFLTDPQGIKLELNFPA